MRRVGFLRTPGDALAVALLVGAVTMACAAGSNPDVPAGTGAGTTHSSSSSSGEMGGAGTSSSSGVSSSGGSSSGSSSSSASSASSASSSGGSPCGNGVVDPGEECDGSNLAGRTCGTVGFAGGTLGCTAQCKLDTTHCGECHDGVVEAALGEDCDFDATSQQPIVTATCMSLGYSAPGKPGCAANCKYDLGPCLCGDGMIDGAEPCDGADLGSHTCASEGFTAGTLTCSPTCALVTTGCTTCGNHVVETGEQCDDGNTKSGDGCSATCQTELTTCDPDGIWTVMGSAVSYTCCSGLVAVSVSSFDFTASGATIDSSPSDPVPMSGAATTCPTGSFSNTATIPGGCAEKYTLTGSFVDDHTWTGTYKLTFTGSQCSCFGGALGTPCVNQVFNITATR